MSRAQRRSAAGSSRIYLLAAECVMLAASLWLPSKVLLPRLVKSHLPVWEARRFPRQLHDKLPLLSAISEGFQQKAFIAFLHYFDFGQVRRHGNRTKIPGVGSSFAI